MLRLSSFRAERLKRWVLRLRGRKSGARGDVSRSEENLVSARGVDEKMRRAMVARRIGEERVGSLCSRTVRKSVPASDQAHFASISSARSGLSINNLPNEIFVQILSYDDETDQGPCSALIASWTCSHWRHIVLHTPTLWSTVRLCTYGAGLSEVLQRSEECSIDFILDPVSAQSIVFPRDVSALLDVLRPHFQRIRSLQLVLPDHDCVETALEELCGMLPNLQTLELNLPYDFISGLQSFASTLSQDISSKFGAVAFGSGEKLRVLRLRAVPFPWHDLAFSHLTTLCMTAMSTEDTAIIWEHLASTLNRHSSTLEELELDQCEFRIEDEEFVHPVIDLPKLKYLHLRLVDPALVTTLLSHVSMPNLETLELEFDDGDQCEVFRALLPNTESAYSEKPTAGSLKRVKNLTIQGGAYPAEVFCEIVGRMPDLERLMLGGCIATSAVIQALSLSRVARKLTDMWLELCENYCAFDLQSLARARFGGVRVHEISPRAG